MTQVGRTCLACLGGSWLRSTIDRANDDGTFDVIPVGQEDDFMAKWHGVTPAELIYDDASTWPAVFDELRGDRATINSAAARAAFARLGITPDDDKWNAFWDHAAKADELDRDRAYEFFVTAGVPAALLADPSLDQSRELFKLYWNQVRMGGREPQPIALADTLRVLHLDDTHDDPEQSAALARFSAAHHIALPASLDQLWSKSGVLDKIRDSHCNNPEPQPAAQWEWRDFEGRHAVRIMLPHQGDHAWWAVFGDGAEDAEIWVSFQEDGGPVRRVARSLSFFFWDLAETGRCWEQSESDVD